MRRLNDLHIINLTIATFVPKNRSKTKVERHLYFNNGQRKGHLKLNNYNTVRYILQKQLMYKLHILNM